VLLTPLALIYAMCGHYITTPANDLLGHVTWVGGLA